MWTKLLSFIGLGLNNVSALIRFKIISNLFGIDGIAAFSIAQNLVQVITSVGGNGSASEFAKVISTYIKQQFYLRNIIFLNFIFGSVIATIFIIVYGKLYAPLSSMVICAGYISIINITLTATLICVQNKNYGKFLILSNIFQLIIIFYMYFFFLSKLDYAVFLLFTPISQLIVLLALLLLYGAQERHQIIKKNETRIWNDIRQIFLSNKGGLVIGASSAASFFAMLLVRLSVQEISGPTVTAYLAIALQLSNFYMLPLQTIIYAHTYPKLIANKMTWFEVIKDTLYMFPILIATQLFVLFTIDFITRFIFDTPATDVLSYYLYIVASDYLKLLGIIFGFILIGRGKSVQYLHVQLLSGIILVLISLTLLNMQLNVASAFLIYYAVYLGFCVYYEKTSSN